MAGVPASSHGYSGGTITAPPVGTFATERIHVADETTYALALYNDTWDSAESDPVAVLAVDNAGNVALFPWSSGRVLSLTTFAGTILFSGVTAAPPDANLAAGQLALWLDQTPAATKLMVKAKDSGGTVRTASIALA